MLTLLNYYKNIVYVSKLDFHLQVSFVGYIVNI